MLVGSYSMFPRRTPEYLEGLVDQLRSLDYENEWVEFKVNNTDPDMIGRTISALSNGAALNEDSSAYMIWGIEDSTHDVVGTRFAPSSAKRGNEPLENWLARKVRPRIDFRFHQVTVEGARVVILEIEPASSHPVAFNGDRFIRVGSVTKSLGDFPNMERSLWRIFDKTPFEDGIAAERVSDDDVLSALDYPAYFNLIGRPLPDGRAAIFSALEMDDLISLCDAGGWNITNLGAVLFAKRLGDFPRLGRKAPRVIQYRGTGRSNALKEQVSEIGYAVGFERIVDYTMAVIPSNEVIERALRRELPMFPKLAIRELIANMLIHQDFSITGAGPMVEIFDDRIEIRNPGAPLVETDRFVDASPESRNEALASLMRRFGICEERGTGIDKVIEEVEVFQLPAPLFEAPLGRSTRATLFAHRELSEMDRPERIRACYQHACLRFVSGKRVNNASVRERFGLSGGNASVVASRILRDTLDSNLIVVRDPEAGTRNRTYLPFWAV